MKVTCRSCSSWSIFIVAQNKWLSANVSEKYNCAWDDVVHDSFWRFVSQVKENGRKLHDIRTETELLEKAVDAHNVDALKSKSLALVKEAEAL